MKKYHVVVCGGTFDLLHEGHKDFINFALSISKKVIIGLTSDKYIEQYKKDRGVEQYDTRKKNLEIYLNSINKLDHVKIIPIDDRFGPTVNNELHIDALAVTKGTEETGREINEKRVGLGLSFLPLEVFDLTLTNGGNPISSTAIRKTLLLPSTLRYLLQDPWGEVLDNIPSDIDSNKLITVGDITTKKFINSGILPFLAIIDFKVERKEIPKYSLDGFKKISVENPSGTISPKLFESVEESFESKVRKVIIVDGEEDLTVLPALLYAPLGFEVFYGQPHQGLVRIKITEESKAKARKLISQFEYH